MAEKVTDSTALGGTEEKKKQRLTISVLSIRCSVSCAFNIVPFGSETSRVQAIYEREALVSSRVETWLGNRRMNSVTTQSWAFLFWQRF